MKKKLFILIAVGIALVYLVLGILLFVDIQFIEPPDTNIHINVSDITDASITLTSNISINNQNSFEIIIKELVITTVTPSGSELATITIDGGTVKGNSNRTFGSQTMIALSDELSGNLSTTVTGTFGVKFLGFIQKTIPLKITIDVSTQELIDSIHSPAITIDARLGNLTIDSIEIISDIRIYNPNSFSLSIQDTQVQIVTENDTSVGSFQIPDIHLNGTTLTEIKGKGTINIEAFNAETLHLRFSTDIGATIAGYTQYLSFSTTSTIQMINFEDYIPADQILEINLWADNRLSLTGIISNTTLEIYNPTEIPLSFTEITVDYYNVKNDDEHFIDREFLAGGEIPPHTTQTFHVEGKLSLLKLIRSPGRGIFPDWIYLKLGVKVSVPGIDIKIPVSVGAYTDFHPLRRG